ncbi:hypothetical protein [Halomonas sp. M20]|uniref:hypothetical protein n=1 Tax=Halomonas sp. M20 TaxID=2763264 RepID=UPI001D0AFB73|nr:hypothetical protein [Halomonas sp. M20]
MTPRLSWNLRQKLKLIALIILFAGPLITAWAMVEWRVGIPDERVAHGQLMPQLPVLSQWPLEKASAGVDEDDRDDWILAYDCQDKCAEVADHLWRLHRALGREAPRVSRLRLGGKADPLPGEQVAQWRRQPAWSDGESVWLIDFEGRVIVRYDQQDDPREILKDIRRLLRMNPEIERFSASQGMSVKSVI